MATNTYDEYGVPGTANLGRFSFTGQTWLPEINQYYYKARMYSPTIGRFMQADPIGYATGMNIYAYVADDPINAIDPSGLDSESGGDGYSFGVVTSGLAGQLRNYAVEKKKEQQVGNSPCAVQSCEDAMFYFEAGAAGDYKAALSAGLAMVMHSWQEGYSSPGKGLLTTMSMLPIVGIEANYARALSTEIKFVTLAGSRYTNIAAKLTTQEMQSALTSAGYKIIRQTTGSNGPVTVLSNGSKTYTLYTATSTGAASAQVTNAAGDIISKIRLTGP